MPVKHAVEIDWEGRQMIVGDTRHWLGPREFDLLKILHRRMGRLVSYDSLIIELWQDDEPEGGDTQKHLQVYVSKLRRKLKDSALYIETIWGEGLRMTEIDIQ